MNTVLVWILLASSLSSNTSPTVIGHFASQKECLSVANQIKVESDRRESMAYLNGICVQATILK